MPAAVVAPVVVDDDVLNIRAHQFAVGVAVTRTVPPRNIDAVVVFGFLLFLACFKGVDRS